MRESKVRIQFKNRDEGDGTGMREGGPKQTFRPIWPPVPTDKNP